MSRVRVLLCAALVAGVLLPAAPAAAAEVYETYHVPTVDGAVIRVEVVRDPRYDPQPVILTYSPYNNTGSTTVAKDSVASRYVPRGYARAKADVLGTRGSTGCWDYGGPKEQQSGVDVVKFLAGTKTDDKGVTLPWSNGAVAMEGVSYNGTTANMVAATGIPELKGIVSVAAISRWYGYAFEGGVRYFGNSRVPTDQGFDTPLLFDTEYGKGFLRDPNNPYLQEILKWKAKECGALEHTSRGYDRDPDYDSFWQQRDYLKDADKFRAASLIVHGWQDYNVKQEEGVDLYEALPVDDPATAEAEGVPFKKLYMSQAAHAGGVGPLYQSLVDRFYARVLKGEVTGIEDEPAVLSLGRSRTGAGTEYQPEASWPPVGTRDLTLHLHRSFNTVPGTPLPPNFYNSTGEKGTLEIEPKTAGISWGFFSVPGVSEEATLQDPLNRKVADRPDGGRIEGHGYVSLYHESAPLSQPARLAGSAVLDAWVNPLTPGQHLTPLLVEVLPDGKLNLVQRGFLNLDYRDGLGSAKPATGPQHAVVEFLPQDYTFSAGSRIGVLVQATNTVWAVPGNPGFNGIFDGPNATAKVPAGTKLILPLTNLPDDPLALFTP